jgi:hypothetical protein
MQSSYTYDGNGRRITKTIHGPTTFTTLFVYNSGGQLIAEYGGPSPENGGTSYFDKRPSWQHPRGDQQRGSGRG